MNATRQPGRSESRGLTPVRRPLVDQVISILEDRLEGGEFQVGDRFPSEPDLMKQLGVGRTTVREAIRVLDHAGLLEVRQGDGTYVRATAHAHRDLARHLQEAQVLEVFAVRRALDLEIVQLAAQRRSDADLAKLRGVLNRMRAAVGDGRDPHAFGEASIELHLTLAAATGNKVLVEVYTSFTTALREAFAQVTALPGVMESCLSRHERLVDAIAEQEPGTAQAITAQYLDRITGVLEKLIEGHGQPAEQAQAAKA
jgi:DNA-binding FadR family transcriptional regulator